MTDAEREKLERWARLLREGPVEIRSLTHDGDEPLGRSALDLAHELWESGYTVRSHRCELPASIQEALNSGDGTYRP